MTVPHYTVWSIDVLGLYEKFVNFQKGVIFSVFGRNSSPFLLIYEK
jgi:hypothetical protein